MELAKVALHTRRYLRDTGGTRFSDWEITEAINDAVSILADADMRVDGELFRETSLVNLGRGDGTLPSGRGKVIRVYNLDGVELLKVSQSAPGEGEYSLSGDRVYSGEDGPLLFVYHVIPDRIESFSASSLDLDEMYLLPLAKAASLIASGEMDKAIDFIVASVRGEHMAVEQGGGDRSAG